MSKSKMLKIVNPLLGLLLITQACSAIFRHQLSYEVFETVHEKGGFLLIILAIVHIYLNWNWVIANYFKRKKA